MDTQGQTAMMRHWIPEGATARPLVKWKDFLTREWTGPDVLLASGEGMLLCFHRIPLLLFGFLTDWFDMSGPMSSPRSWRPLRSLRSLESWSPGPREDGKIRSLLSPDLREQRRSRRASDPSPEASPLVHHFRHLALQERHADRVQPYSAPPHHRHHTQATTSSTVPTWGQLKHLTQQA